MDLQYKTVYKGQWAGGANKSMGIEFHLALDRDLIDKEANMLRKFVDEFTHQLNRNTLLADPHHLRNLAEEKTDLISCFSDPVYVMTIPNEYHSDATNPWFLVTTSKGHIKIGWRKRVIVIDWAQSDVNTPAEELFPDEDVTKYDKLIHAYGYEKAKEYIQKILK